VEYLPDGGREVWSYDEHDRLLQYVRYAADNTVLAETTYYPDGSTKLSYTRNGAEVITREYNEAGKKILYSRTVNDVYYDYEAYTYDPGGTVRRKSVIEYHRSDGSLITSQIDTFYPDGTKESSLDITSDGTRTRTSYDGNGNKVSRHIEYPDGTSEEIAYFPGMTRYIAYYPNNYRKSLTELSDNGDEYYILYRENGSRSERVINKANGTYDRRYYNDQNQLERWFVLTSEQLCSRYYTNGRMNMERVKTPDGTPIRESAFQYSVSATGQKVILEIVYDASGKETDRRWYEDDGKLGYPPED